MAVNDVNIRIRAQDDTKGAFGSVKSSLGGLRSSIFSVQTAIAGIAGSLVAKTVIDANRSFQSLQASLITFTGSADAANRQFAVLQDFAAKTPFSLEEVVGGFNKLVARGITPSIESLTAFGNIASGTGKSLDQFIEAVADAAVGEFERLKEFGIKANTEGNKIKLTFGGVTKEIGKNSQEMLSYLEALGQTKFAGAIERQSQTLNGAFSNLGDAISKLSVAIGEAGLNKFLVDATRSMTGLIEQFEIGIRSGLTFAQTMELVANKSLMGGGEALKYYRSQLALMTAQMEEDFGSGGLMDTALDERIKATELKIKQLLGVSQTNFRGRGFTDTRVTGKVGTIEEQNAKKVIQLTDDQKKAIEDYKKSIVDAENSWAGAMTQSEKQARNRLKVIEDTHQAMAKVTREQFSGYLDKAERTKRQETLPSELEVIREEIEKSDKAIMDANKLKFEGYLDPEQRGKRKFSLPSELEAIREGLEASKSPLKEYAEAAQNLQLNLENVALRGVKSLEDALVGLVNGTMSAKDAFRSMATSIINDLIRMQIQKSITGPISNALDGLFSGSGGGKAIGGSVQAGKPYMVGERGAEMFVPNQSGSIIPNNAFGGGGGGTTIVQNINVTTGVQQTVRAEIMTLMPQIANAAKSAVADAKLRGGSYAAAMR